ncbi:hypothetical protein HMPREF1861_01753 [Corynebacterium kroppenstedtii]|nr:hypothetical protein HMPREF1861_01753 [Corynebacterium kroppenstedtii]
MVSIDRYWGQLDCRRWHGREGVACAVPFFVLLWVFCGCVLGVCGVWVGCVVFFVVAEAARPVTGKAVIWLWVVLVVGVEILSLFLFAGFGACLRLAGCGVRVSACCTCW